MVLYEKTARISRTGQITLPKAVREALRTDIVRLVVGNDGIIRLEPVASVGGGLAHYARGYVPTQQSREVAWQQVCDEENPRSLILTWCFAFCSPTTLCNSTKQSGFSQRCSTAVYWATYRSACSLNVFTSCRKRTRCLGKKLPRNSCRCWGIAA